MLTKAEPAARQPDANILRRHPAFSTYEALFMSNTDWITNNLQVISMFALHLSPSLYTFFHFFWIASIYSSLSLKITTPLHRKEMRSESLAGIFP